MGRPFSPQNCPFPLGNLDTHLIHGSLGPPESTTQTASRSVQPFLQGSRSRQTHRPTDHATSSVTIGCIYVVLPCGLSVAMKLKDDGQNKAGEEVVNHTRQSVTLRPISRPFTHQFTVIPLPWQPRVKVKLERLSCCHVLHLQLTASHTHTHDATRIRRSRSVTVSSLGLQNIGVDPVVSPTNIWLWEWESSVARTPQKFCWNKFNITAEKSTPEAAL